jgi:HK97 gp10 family phage protein
MLMSLALRLSLSVTKWGRVANKADIKLIGEKELKKYLDELPDKIKKRALRKAVTAGATPIVKAAKRNAPKESGLLKKSMTKKIKTYKGTGGAVVAVIGSDRGVAGMYDGKKRIPSNYIALVEYGHAGPNPAPAHQFLRPAVDANKDRSVAAIQSKLKEAIEAEKAKT